MKKREGGGKKGKGGRKEGRKKGRKEGMEGGEGKGRRRERKMREERRGMGAERKRELSGRELAPDQALEKVPSLHE
jgi:hypothetical protein